MDTNTAREEFTVTPSIRFAAARFAQGLPYEGPENMRVTIETAGKVEAFPTSYSDDEVTAAKMVLVVAAKVSAYPEDDDALELARHLFWTGRNERGPAS